MAAFYLLVVTFLVLNVVNAATLLECVCSPSTRGYRTNVLNELIESRKAVLDFTSDQWAKLKLDPTLKRADLQREIDQKVFALWNSCLSNWKHEECVNADTKLRDCNAENKDNCISFCNYNTNNWRNILNGQDAVGCDTNAVLASQDPNIISGKPEQPTIFKPTSSNPTPSATPSKKTALPVPTKTPTPNSNTSNNQDSQTPNASATPSASVFVNGTNAAQNPSPGITAGSVNEGCVAIEHLHGYDLQHKYHLRRIVLCSAPEAFCATPNHAIIVDGEWTSMKQLCKSTWKCVRTVKLVNNLRITSHRRAIISERIVITPFDARYPRWCVWVVQILEMVFNGVEIIEIIAGVIALFIYNVKL